MYIHRSEVCQQKKLRATTVYNYMSHVKIYMHYGQPTWAYQN